MTDEARFEALRARLGELIGRSHALAHQLGNLDLGELLGPPDLALIPVLRKSAIAALQSAQPPFGALAAAPTSAFPRLFASPGGIYEPESAGGDTWGAAKARASSQAKLSSTAFHITSPPAGGSSKAALFRSAAPSSQQVPGTQSNL
jgi:hypothetical protein